MLMTLAARLKGVKVLFAHDTEVALAAAAALVNTEEEGGMETLDELDAFVAEWGWTGSRHRARAELDAVRALRPRLRRLWYEDVDGAVEIVNDLLREANALPQLVKHDRWNYHLHATSPEVPLAVASRSARRRSAAITERRSSWRLACRESTSNSSSAVASSSS